MCCWFDANVVLWLRCCVVSCCRFVFCLRLVVVSVYIMRCCLIYVCCDVVSLVCYMFVGLLFCCFACWCSFCSVDGLA